MQQHENCNWNVEGKRWNMLSSFFPERARRAPNEMVELRLKHTTFMELIKVSSFSWPACHLTYTKILRSEKLPQSVALCKLFSETLRKEVLKEAIILHVFTMPSSHCMPPLRTNLVALLIWKFPPSFHPPPSPSLTPAVIRRKQMIPGNNLLINQIQELLSAT